MSKKLKPKQGLLREANPDGSYNKKQLKIGTKIELEHTRNKTVAKRIAKHHLDEHPRYYIELGKMERKLEQDKKSWSKRKREEFEKTKYIVRM